jgi:hypothetical protein
MRLQSSILVTAVMLSAAFTARADMFTLTVEGQVDTFTLPASPVISNSYEFGFAIASVPFNEDGVAVVRQIDFFNASTGGGLLIEGADGPEFNGEGDALFTGSNTRPTFLLGSFDPVGTDSGVLTISNPTVAPEPSSGILIATALLGILGLLTCFRNRA